MLFGVQHDQCCGACIFASVMVVELQVQRPL
jgi:NADH:ubiquinone oxidoreductase subunit E